MIEVKKNNNVYAVLKAVVMRNDNGFLLLSNICHGHVSVLVEMNSGR